MKYIENVKNVSTVKKVAHVMNPRFYSYRNFLLLVVVVFCLLLSCMKPVHMIHSQTTSPIKLKTDKATLVIIKDKQSYVPTNFYFDSHMIGQATGRTYFVTYVSIKKTVKI